MRRVVLVFILSCSLFVSNVMADPVNLNPDPDGDPWYAGLPELTPEQEEKIEELPRLDRLGLLQAGVLPVSVDNSTHKYFRPIFSQQGGSCGQASGIGYTFTYEMAFVRDLDASITANQYPEHFTWNFLNKGNGNGSWYFDGWDIAKDNGIPNVTTYGGMSSPSPYIQWMSGYDKYYAGMANRTLDYFTIDVSTHRGIQAMRQWMDNHAGGAPFGGLVNFATNMSGLTSDTLDSGTPHAEEAIITSFGDTGYHAMTFVGYDDTIKYDFNNDGNYTNDVDINNDGVVDLRDAEIGAVKVANSWGTSWMDDGFAWVMYRVLALDRREGGITSNLVYGVNVKETNTAQMALKINMTHSSRQKIRLRAGVASDVNATVPDQSITYSLFNYQGGDYPMRGDSEDAIEIGLDVSQLYDMVGEEDAKKFFLIVDENDRQSEATGEIISLALVDYTRGGIEYAGETNVSIKNNATTYVGVARTDSIECIEETATNTAHEAAGRAHSVGATYFARYYAVGSEDYLGYGRATTTLAQTSPGHWVLGECPEIVDPNPPMVDITEPAEEAVLNKVETVCADASDDVAIDRVVFSIPDGRICTAYSAPYCCEWNTASVANGDYTLTATAYDTADNTDTSSIQVTVDNPIDDDPPAVSITAPEDGAVVSGTVTSYADAADDVAIDRVEFSIPDYTLCTDYTAPYSCSGDTTLVENGDYEFTVTAYDTSGNSTSSSITVSVQNTPVCREWTATNSEHEAAGRAYSEVNFFRRYYAVGSNDNLGYARTTTTLRETRPGFFEKGSCGQ